MSKHVIGYWQPTSELIHCVDKDNHEIVVDKIERGQCYLYHDRTPLNIKFTTTLLIDNEFSDGNKNVSKFYIQPPPLFSQIERKFRLHHSAFTHLILSPSVTLVNSDGKPYGELGLDEQGDVFTTDLVTSSPVILTGYLTISKHDKLHLNLTYVQFKSVEDN